MRFFSAFLALLLFSASAVAGEKLVYSVADYDAKRDAVKDLKTTLETAKKDNRTVLVIAGGSWCGWCRRMDEVLKNKPEVRDILSGGYVIMKANYSGSNENPDFFAKYPDFGEFPHFFVLNATGELQTAQNPADWEKLGGYEVDKLAAFFKKWAPKGSSAE
ncbi:MAG: thioredoxin-related protein [Verrucomicrobiales bacterium]|jgi:thioredoxin-related protein